MTAADASVAEHARRWAIAVGLQDVDRLTPSDRLIELVKANIEGTMTDGQVMDAVQQQCDAEADRVAARIYTLLNDSDFKLQPAQLVDIHKYLFDGIHSHAGQFRTRNVIKNQWVLNGDSVEYGHASSICKQLAYDFETEKKFDYSSVSAVQAIGRIARFISSVWQTHPFLEGNTRTVAVFLIKYLEKLGFGVKFESFEKHSWYFRNALVRSQYENVSGDIYPTYGPLEQFVAHAVLGTEADLRNRTLHVAWEAPIAQNNALKKSGLLSELTIKEVLILNMIIDNPAISISQMATDAGLSRSTVDRIIASLKEKGLLMRTGAKNKPLWSVACGAGSF